MTSNDTCWAIVAARDGTGTRAHFVYAVTTTGIYCRPGCASRTPRRENVRFHDDAESAEAAGFRYCKRCARRDGIARTPADT